MSGAMSAAVGGGGVLMVILVLFMIAVRQRCAKRKPRSAPPPSSQPASPDKLREKDDSESDDRNPDIIPSDTDQMQVCIVSNFNYFYFGSCWIFLGLQGMISSTRKARKIYTKFNIKGLCTKNCQHSRRPSFYQLSYYYMAVPKYQTFKT